jgi:hypothetical protein
MENNQWKTSSIPTYSTWKNILSPLSKKSFETWVHLSKKTSVKNIEHTRHLTPLPKKMLKIWRHLSKWHQWKTSSILELKNTSVTSSEKSWKFEDICRRRHQRKTSSILDTCHLFRKNAENLKTPVEEDINGKHQAYSTWENILSPLQKKVLKPENTCRRRHQVYWSLKNICYFKPGQLFFLIFCLLRRQKVLDDYHDTLLYLFCWQPEESSTRPSEHTHFQTAIFFFSASFVGRNFSSINSRLIGFGKKWQAEASLPQEGQSNDEVDGVQQQMVQTKCTRELRRKKMNDTHTCKHG